MTSSSQSQKSSASANQRTAVWIVVGLLVVAWLCIYAQVRHFDFLNFDDDMFLSNNPWLKQGLTWLSVQWAFTADLFIFSKHAEYWSPITLLSRLVDSEVYGMNPGAFHVTSACIHLLNAALLWAALYQLTRTKWRSLAVAALFLVHPLNVEPVCWLSARKDLLGATFFFVTLLAYAWYARQPSTRRYVLLVLAFVAALMAKPMAITTPLLLFVLDWWPLERWQNPPVNTANWRQLIAEKLPVLLLSIGGAVLAVFSQRNWGAIQDPGQYPFPARVNNALVSYVIYLRRIFWPDDLAIFYPHPGRALPLAWGVIAFLILVLVSVSAVLLVRRYPFFLSGWIWFGLVLGPVIGLVQIGDQAMADRYAYTSVIGIFIVIVWTTAKLLEKQPAIAATGAAIVVLALSLVSTAQVRTWKDSETVFTHALAVTKNNDLAHLNLGNVYFLRNDFAAAREQYRQSVAIKPNQFRVWNNLGVVESRLGKQDEATQAYLRALEINPAERKSRMALARIFIDRSQPRNAEELLRQATVAEPNWPDPFFELGKLYAAQSRWTDAVALWSSYLQTHPGDSAARQALQNAESAAQTSHQ